MAKTAIGSKSCQLRLAGTLVAKNKCFMDIEKEFLDFLYRFVVRIIDESKSDSNISDEFEEILNQANIIKAVFESSSELKLKVNESIRNEEHYENVELSEEFVIFYAIRDYKLFKKLYAIFSEGEIAISGLQKAILLELWANSTEYSGVEKYFNTPDELFNANAYYWYIALKENGLFTDIELPFKILNRYFEFLDSPDKPISSVDKVFKDFDDHELDDEQRVFILDRFTGMLSHSDDFEILSNIFIELVDRRHDISSYLDDPEVQNNIWDIEKLRAECEKLDSIPEKRRFLKLKKLEYQRQSEEIQFDIGFGDEIDAELQYLDDIEKSNRETTFEAFIQRKTNGNIPDRAYEQIIGFILRIGKNLEKIKNLTSNFDEEAYRDYFLPFLNAISKEYSATGETFNKIGKTDILIQNNEGDNIFIGECKIWKGEQKLLEAVDQLFDRYVNWRDEKLALLIFNKKNKNFTKVIDTAVDTLKKHEKFKNYIGKRMDTAYSYVFTHPVDSNKVVKVELILFDFA